MKISVSPSVIETTRKLILHIIQLMDNEPGKVFNIALSGGSTPAIMFDLWANEYKQITSWNRIKFFWVDERCVPPEDSDSNYGVARALLLAHVPISYENVFRIKGENTPEDEALRYSRIVAKRLPIVNHSVKFDVILLGAGDDGHTASIFPGQEHLLSSDLAYSVAFNPYNGQRRITMTGNTILNADNVIFFVTGKNKANVVKEICDSGDMGPAAYIAHHAKHVLVFMDDLAASEVDGKFCEYLND